MAKLDISFNYNSGEDPYYSGDPSKASEDFIRPIASMLKTNWSIKEVNLAGNNLNAEAARIFSQDIHDNGALASLDISNNKLTQGEQDGKDAFGIPKYKTDLSGVIDLADALKK